MMTKIIELDIKDSITGLAGFPYGQEVFKTQVKNKINENDYKEGIEIIFPNNIQRVASSFIQGFFSDLIDKYGYYDVKNFVKVKTISNELSKSIFNILE